MDPDYTNNMSASIDNPSIDNTGSPIVSSAIASPA